MKMLSEKWTKLQTPGALRCCVTKSATYALLQRLLTPWKNRWKRREKSVQRSPIRKACARQESMNRKEKKEARYSYQKQSDSAVSTKLSDGQKKLSLCQKPQPMGYSGLPKQSKNRAGIWRLKQGGLSRKSINLEKQLKKRRFLSCQWNNQI